MPTHPLERTELVPFTDDPNVFCLLRAGYALECPRLSTEDRTFYCWSRCANFSIWVFPGKKMMVNTCDRVHTITEGEATNDTARPRTSETEQVIEEVQEAPKSVLV